MAHKLSRLTKSILEQPQLMSLASFEAIAEVLDNRENYTKTLAAAQLAADNDISSQGQEDLVETTVGILRIDGSLTYKTTGWEALCGGVSYQSLISQTKELCLMDSVKTIMMDVDSGGGEAFRMMETAREIRSLCDEHGKYLIAYVDGYSASAAYGLTAVAHEVVMNPDSQVGSIGVVVRLTNNNEAMKEAGISTTYITAGDSKVPFDKDGEFREDFISDIQDKVTELYDNFTSHVATSRNISQELVKDTEAKMFSADKALELGLVDKVMEGEEFYTYLAELSIHEDEDKKSPSKVTTIKLEDQEVNQELQTTLSTEEHSMTDKTQKTETSVDNEMLAKLQATMEKQAEQLAAYQAKDEQAAMATLSASLDKYTFLAESKDQVVSFLSDSTVSADHKALLNTVLSASQDSYESLEEKASADIAEAQLATDTAIEEKDKIKEEFGNKENATTEVPEKALNVTDTLKEKVALKKAAKLAAKNA